jgi:hypothetical protein
MTDFRRPRGIPAPQAAQSAAGRPRWKEVDLGRREHAEQVDVVARVRALGGPESEFSLFHAVQNWAGVKDGREGAARKAEGVIAGIPDLDWPVRRGGYIGLRIEMKRIRRLLTKTKGVREERTRCTAEQLRMQRLLREVGHFVAVCWTAEEAWEVFWWYHMGATGAPPTGERG